MSPKVTFRGTQPLNDIFSHQLLCIVIAIIIIIIICHYLPNICPKRKRITAKRSSSPAMSYFKGHFINDGTTPHYPEHLSQQNQQPTKENVALFKASKAGSMLAVRNALQDGAKPNFFFNPEDSKNALHVSAEEGHVEVVRELLTHGAVVDCLVLGSKDTALSLACRTDRPVIARDLIEAGADINHANVYGNTPLHEAIREDFLDLAAQLVDAGADVTLSNHKGSTPLHFLCYASREEVSSTRASADMAKMLISKGASVNSEDHEGLTPYLVCCASGREDLMDLLDENGADVSARDHKNRSGKEIAEFYKQTHLASRFSRK